MAHLGRGSLLNLLEAVTFNVAIGNVDAHARNLSVMLHADGWVSLAPLSDLVATRLYPMVHRDAAQRVAGVEAIDDITIDHLVSHAGGWGLPERLVRSRVEQLVRRIRLALPTVTRLVVDDLGGRGSTAADLADLVTGRLFRLAG